MTVIMTVMMMMMMTSLTQRDLGEGQEDGDHDDTRGDRAQYQEILTGMGGMPPQSSPILSLLGPLYSLSSLARPLVAIRRPEPEPRGRASVLVITDPNYHCFVDTMHTQIVVNNGLNESEKSRQYFE